MGLNVVVSNEDLARFVAAKVESGEYASANEVIEHALQAFAEAQKPDEEKLAWLRAAWDKGVASGNVGSMTAEDFKREAQRRREAKA